MKQYSSLLVIGVVVSALLACGGGGDDEPDPGPSPYVPTPTPTDKTSAVSFTASISDFRTRASGSSFEDRDEISVFPVVGNVVGENNRYVCNKGIFSATLGITKKESYSSDKLELHSIYDSLTNLLNSKNLTIKHLSNDYCLCLSDTAAKSFKLNYALDSFYHKKETDELFKNYRNTLLNIILSYLKKYEKRLENIDDKLDECKNMDKYKLYGELLTANLYKIPNYNIPSIKLENGIDMPRVRKYLAFAQQQILQDKRYSSLQFYYDVDPL